MDDVRRLRSQSLGKQNRGRDPSALLVGGLNRETGILDVVEARIARRLPDKIIEDVIALQREHRCLVWGVEAVQFQEFFRTELVRRSAERGVPVPAVPIMTKSDKALRIESLQPHVANGLIRFHPSQTVLLDQLRHFPKGDHDDGPDCLEMLWVLAIKRMRMTAGIQRAGPRPMPYEQIHNGFRSDDRHLRHGAGRHPHPARSRPRSWTSPSWAGATPSGRRTTSWPSAASARASSCTRIWRATRAPAPCWTSASGRWWPANGR